VNVQYLSTVAVIAPDPAASCELYLGAVGLLEGRGNGCYHSEQIAGCKSFGIWPLTQAAEACFGTPRWPAERAVPHVSTEFDVATPLRSARRRRSSSKPGISCCTQRAQSRRVRRSPGYSRGKPSDGLEPSTPSLSSWDRRRKRGHDRVTAGTKAPQTKEV
jgi:hypothetical protein